MRSEEEIEVMFQNLGEHDDSPISDWRGDSFKYGYQVGKLTALAWVLGDHNAGDMNSNYDFDDFVLERHSTPRIPPLDGPSVGPEPIQ